MLPSAPPSDLYEAAVPRPSKGAARLHLGQGTLYLGPLGDIAPHAHATHVLVAGLYEAFRLRLATGPWTHCRMAVVAAGAVHALQTGDAPVAVLYPSPLQADHRSLAALVTGADEIGPGCLTGSGGETGLFREMLEGAAGAASADHALDELLRQRSLQRRARTLDPRVRRAVEALQQAPDRAPALTHLAGAIGLSSSRLMHLFAKDMGIPYRRYRTWCRLQMAMRNAQAGASLTDAALQAGFCDSQHFAHEFRRAFGMTASDVMHRLRPP